MSIVQTNVGGVAGNSQDVKALGFTAVAGRLLLMCMSCRQSGIAFQAVAGWSLLVSGGNPGIALYAKIAAGSDTFPGYVGIDWNQHGGVCIEFSGAALPLGANAGVALGNNNTGPTLTPTAGAECDVVGAVAKHGFQGASAPGAPWTAINIDYPPFGDHPRMSSVHQLIASASGSYTPIVGGDTGNQSFAGVILYPSAPPAVPRSRAVIIS